MAMFLSLPLHPALTQQFNGLDAESLRQQFFLVIRAWLEAIAQDTPLVITFNDMHWADTTSLQLLKYCLPLCDYLDILWILITRSERASPIWDFRYFLETEYPHRLTTLQLSPLSPEQSEEFILCLIGSDCLPHATIQMLVAQAEGNPYYIQELIRTLIANGTLIRESTLDEHANPIEVWRLTQEVTSISVPDSLQSVLTARIDRLSIKEQQVLQMAAVIGSTFWSKLLYGLASDFPDLTMHITALLRAQLITERGRVPDLGVEYIFKSNLVRDVAYAMLLRSQRETSHMQIAEFMEQLVGESLPTQPSSRFHAQYCSFLSYHYHHANQPEQELKYILKNAEYASKVYANAEAAQLYTQALQLIDQLENNETDQETGNVYNEQRFDVLFNRHSINYLLGDFTAMRVDAEALLPLAQVINNDIYKIDALLHQPSVDDFYTLSTIQNGLAMAQDALVLSRRIKDRRREMECLIALVNLKLMLNDISWHIPAEQALEIARELNDINYETRLLIGMGSVYAFGDQPERGVEYFEKAVSLAMNQALDDKVIQMSLLNMLGLEYERKGDYYRLLTEYQQERLSASREIGHRPLESQALQARGRIKAIYLGDYTSGLNDLEECRNIMKNTPDEVYVLFHIAHIHIAQANHIDALAALKMIQTIGEPCQDRGIASLKLLWIMYHNALGTRAATRSDDREVISQLTQALDLVARTRELTLNSPFVSIHYQMAAECQAVIAHLGLAQTEKDPILRQKHLDHALETSESAYEIYQLYGFVQIIECVSEEVFFRHNQALAANGKHDLALRYLQRAYDEMMNKLEMIPNDSYFRKTYVDQIPLHQEIRAAHAIRTGLLTQTAERVI